MKHDIDVGERKSIATRDFSFDLALTTDHTAAAVTITIDRAKASYVAHDMKQRLGTRHLPGQSFPLSIAEGGRRLQQVDAADDLLIDLGPVPSPGFSVAGLLADTLPVLPEKNVTLGGTWTTERRIRSIGGWGWGVGQLTSQHRITSIDRDGEHTIISVTTEAEASLEAPEDAKEFTSDLKRTLHWTFDATDGRLLSLSMDQTADGTCIVPQMGEIKFHQLTQVELAPLA